MKYIYCNNCEKKIIKMNIYMANDYSYCSIKCRNNILLNIKKNVTINNIEKNNNIIKIRDNTLLNNNNISLNDILLNNNISLNDIKKSNKKYEYNCNIF